MFKVLQTFFESLKQLFSCAETFKTRQIETDMVKTKKQLWKKSDKQEDLILDMASLLTKYSGSFSKADRVKAKNCLKKIKKVN